MERLRVLKLMETGLAAILLSLPVLASTATYTVTNTNNSGPGSLRQAISDANANSGMDTIEFNIPGMGPHTIQPLSELPIITDPVLIDGYTQPGASPNTSPVGTGLNTVLMIELDGSLTGADASGLVITAGGSTVQGLVINRFDVYGIFLYESGGNLVQGNFVGSDVNGTVAQGVGYDGVYVLDVPNNTIGGATPQARNLISGNGNNGVSLMGGDAIGNWVAGNLIGTDAHGTADLGNLDEGVAIGDNASRNIVGGNPAVAANTIAFNLLGGIRVASGVGNGILGNSIFSNGDLGIDLKDDGVTPNDSGDPDVGPNHLQNFPVLLSATITVVQGKLNSTPDTDFILEFFANSECDPSNYGEGENYLGSTWVTTDGIGDVDFAFTFPAPVPVGELITATATSIGDTSTSEFSRCFEVMGPEEDVCVEFEDLVLGTTYSVVNAFVSSGITINVDKYQWDFGGWTSSGYAEVEDGKLACHLGQEMLVHEVNLKIYFDGPITGLFLLFGEYGGNLNIKVNDDFQNFEDFDDINGFTIGGTAVSVGGDGSGSGCGSLLLSGTIDSFGIGGQELWIDHICPEGGDEGACCLEDGHCIFTTETVCNSLRGDYLGDGSVCRGDLNGNGWDDACEPTLYLGDVNGDWEINVLDVVEVVNHILGIDPLQGDPLLRADCNCDQEVNIIDCIGIVNVILGIGECGPGACKTELTDEAMEFLKALEPHLPPSE